MNTPYEALLGRILPLVLPCPKSIALDNLQLVGMHFSSETGVWQETFTETISPCETVIYPLIPKEAAICAVEKVEIDGVAFEVASYGQREIRLGSAPGREGLLICRLCLRPLRLASGMPRDLIEEYGDYLIYGALAKLKGMSGLKVEWTDPKGAELYYGLYQEGLLEAKARKFRKRYSGRILYLNTGDI